MSRFCRGRWMWMAVTLTGASLFVVQASSLWTRAVGYGGSDSHQDRSPIHATLARRPIEQVRLGDKVPGENPVETPDDRLGSEVDAANWRKIELRCRKRDGSDADVALLRPEWWLRQQGASVGGQIRISVPECGIDGDALVLGVDPCPQIQSGVGNVVIGTYRHHNAKVVDLFVEGLDKPIGATPNHRFWSLNKQRFMRADQLSPGEELSLINGTTKLVDRVNRDGFHDVYNLETYPGHVYHVSLNGVLVHNAGPPTPNAGLTVTKGPDPTPGVQRATFTEIPGAFIRFNENAPETGTLRVLDIDTTGTGFRATTSDLGYAQSGNMIASLIRDLGMNKPGQTIDIKIETIITDTYKDARTQGRLPEDTNFGRAIKNAAEALGGKSSNIAEQKLSLLPANLKGKIEFPDCP